MARQITLTIPDPIHQQAKQVVQGQNRLADDTTNALAAVERLTTLFSDVTIDRLEQILDDPLVELANYALIKSDQ